MKTALIGKVVLPDKLLPRGVVMIEGEKIAGVYSQEDRISEGEIVYVDYNNKFISPGLVDLHCHGALGKDVMDADVESLKVIASHKAKTGVTGFLGTTFSSPLDLTVKAVETIRKAAERPLESEILGVYIEGPFLNMEEKGAQDGEFIRGIEEEDIQLLRNATQGLKTVFTVAPEVSENLNFIKRLKESGAVIAIGHSSATYEQAFKSFQAGVSHATHFFNAMREFHSREPGVVGAVLDCKEISVELIADGIHIHPALLRLALKSKGKDKICLITDSIKAAGLGDGLYTMGNIEIAVNGERTTLRDSDVLAGSVLKLNKALKNVIEWTGLPVNQAVNMASLNPARVLGLDRTIGSIQKGKYANLAIFDEEFRVVATYFRGKNRVGETGKRRDGETE